VLPFVIHKKDSLCGGRFGTSNKSLLVQERKDFDVCGKCCVIEELPLCGRGVNYCVYEIYRAGEEFFPGNRQAGL